MKLYLLGIGLLTLIIASFGFILPFLFSAESTELVIAGWVVLVIDIPLIIVMGKALILNALKVIAVTAGKGFLSQAKKSVDEYKQKKKENKE